MEECMRERFEGLCKRTTFHAFFWVINLLPCLEDGLSLNQIRYMLFVPVFYASWQQNRLLNMQVSPTYSCWCDQYWHDNNSLGIQDFNAYHDSPNCHAKDGTPWRYLSSSRHSVCGWAQLPLLVCNCSKTNPAVSFFSFSGGTKILMKLALIWAYGWFVFNQTFNGRFVSFELLGEHLFFDPMGK